jgi:hypothetical protein
MDRISDAFQWMRVTLKPRDIFLLIPVTMYFGFLLVTQLAGGHWLPALASAAWLGLLIAFLLWSANRRKRRDAERGPRRR